MTTDIAVNAKHMASRQKVLTKRVKRMALTVPAITLLIGAIAAVSEPRSGFFAAALVLGWTRLVGL